MKRCSAALPSLRSFALVSALLIAPLAAVTPVSALQAVVAPATAPSAAHKAYVREEIQQKHIDNPEAEDGANVYRHSPMVHSLAHAMGLSVESTSRLFETANFVLLVLLILWGVLRLMPKALRARTERIQNEIQQARTATAEANRRLAGVEERLSRLDDEIRQIRTQAEQETAMEEKRLRAAIEEEKQGILDAATQDIQAATKNAQSQLRKLAADLILEKAIRQAEVTPEADQQLVDGFLSRLQNRTIAGERRNG